jgi:hypothetical protein
MMPGLRIRYLLLSVILGFPFILFSQQSTLKINAVNQQKEPIPFSSILLKKLQDSTTINLTTDSLGFASIDVISGQQYILTVTSVNFVPYERGIIISSPNMSVIVTLEASKELQGVTVRSSRPLMRQEDDKTIIDPTNLVESSTSGYEVIEKTPGLFMDQDGNIYVHSTTPATILINGREMKMSTADIASMLKSLPPNSIQSIEIVRTPSAKYDASGSGGVVNVILKKGVRLGLTGSVNIGAQQGTYGNQFAGFNLNTNNGQVSTYLNFNYTRRNSFEQIKTDRIFAPDSLLSQDAYTKYPSDAFFSGIGLSYEPTSKWQLSYDGRLSYNQFGNKTDNASIIEKQSTSEVITRNLNRVSNKGHSIVINQGVNAKYKIDSLGSEWTTDISYTFASNPSTQNFITSFFVPSLPDFGGDGEVDTKRNFITAQTDLVLKLPYRVTFEAGGKTSYMKFESETDYYRSSGGLREKDPSRTNTFRYRENINSAYAQASKTFFKNVILKFGTRLENTVMKGRQIIPGDTSFNINRTDFFPYVYLSKKVISIAGFELRAYLVYRRTITRPVYEQLNPFPRFIDQYLSEVGNPTLRPQFNQNYEANISINEMPILAIGINKTKDIFTNVIYQSDSNYSQAFRTYDNLGTNKEFYLRGLGAIPPGGKYFFVLGGQYNHNFYEGLYENKPLAFKKGSWTFFTYHTLKLGNRSQLTVNGFIRMKGQLQFYELSTFGSLNASINRSFLNQKLMLTLSMSDIFRTYRNEFIINQGTVNANGFRAGDTQRIGLNLRYNFGIRKKEEKSNFLNISAPETRLEPR